MDIKKRKEELVQAFNQTNQQIEQMIARREQIRGQVALLEEQEREEAPKKKGK